MPSFSSFLIIFFPHFALKSPSFHMDYFFSDHMSIDIYKVAYQYFFTKSIGDNYMIYSLIIIIIARSYNFKLL